MRTGAEPADSEISTPPGRTLFANPIAPGPPICQNTATPIRPANPPQGARQSANPTTAGRHFMTTAAITTTTPAAPQGNPIRVLVAKPGLDGHDRGAKVIARALRDAGMEVIYTGIRQTPQMVAQAAAQEDVAVLGLSILSGAHMELMPEIMRLLDEQDMNDVLVLLGGIVPEEDREPLAAMGVSAVFGPGTSTNDIIAYINAHAPVS